MAISYSLEIATQLSPGEVAHAVREAGRQAALFSDAVTLEQILGDGALAKGGSVVQVMEPLEAPYDVVADDLGFAPTSSVEFQINTSNPVHYQQDDVVALTVGVLKRVPGDAVLHRETETIWLLRRDGELTVNEQDDIWPPHRLALVDIPYRRETHTFD
ncbi:SitI3 family protein [Allokutzneria sp. A3M-2-11 16]|uniref:SitI3 family protein n=1 Tax=Allokutzneria sp. A3M-2-11 16 TaxID=2962043 RepID=UPI0020B7D87B|nr:SitI3 family protein [Allokutzneria sp. A3M-2-11 16]MCP3803943.1 SitI3 family protein [Allokutzneria sp. A3M-2-11 16]